MKDAYQVMVEKHHKVMQRLTEDWKTSDEKKDQRIAELKEECDCLRDYVAILTDKEGPNDEQKK